MKEGITKSENYVNLFILNWGGKGEENVSSQGSTLLPLNKISCDNHSYIV